LTESEPVFGDHHAEIDRRVHAYGARLFVAGARRRFLFAAGLGRRRRDRRSGRHDRGGELSGPAACRVQNAAIAADKVESGRIEELARQISALQSAVDLLSRRVAALEANAANAQRPLATQPW
jgi:hypothetical protein